MEAIVAPQGRDHWDKMGIGVSLRGTTLETGEKMVLEDNYFIEEILPNAILRGSPERRWRSIDGHSPSAARAAADANLAPANTHRR